MSGGSWDHGDADQYEDPTLRFRQRPHSTSIIQSDFRADCSKASFESNSPTEDTLQIVEDDDQVFVGVYDGHGGTSCSAFLRDNFFELFSDALAQSGDVSTAYETSVPFADRQYTAEAKASGDWQALFTGSCLVSVHIDKKRMCAHCANCGDSRAVIGQEVSNLPLDTINRSVRRNCFLDRSS